MYRSLRSVFLIVLIIMIAGCSGRNFARPNPGAFNLGKTTYPQVVEQMGTPRNVSNSQHNGATIMGIRYGHSKVVGAIEEGVIPVRSLWFYFYKDVLVGQSFDSSFRSDNTDFDDSKVGNIVKGKTSRAEVLQLLGRPSGSYIHPMVKKTFGEAIGYKYMTFRNSENGIKAAVSKNLLITFDDKDAVSDVEFTSSRAQ